MNELDIFTAALELADSAERARYLDEACGTRPELRERIEALLRNAAHASQFLESPPFAADATIAQPITEKPGTVIGPYKLLQEIGHGGMGVVYMAEQTEPVERRVALKIIKPGMDTRQVIARFEAERQALAMMDHPSISKVFDAGTTDTGRPYFVMELVKGVPITKYCDEHHLSPRERLELFVPVCQAVQHAHQKGIIHRDIKPSNVMVAEYDDRPIPKIIDFGVAKAVEQRLTEKTVFTQLGQVVGTIDYMSPEQTKLNQLDIDTRSDIYSLGVLLYELLTGETPLDRERLHAAAFDEMLRIIREEEPQKPSLRLSSSHTLPSIAANRHIEPKKLSTLVRGELDWIVMKALEKDRSRRYETANGFAGDIQRYLNDEPVEACPPSAAYRFKKFARRNKVTFATTAVVAASLLVGTGVATWQAIRATQAERETQTERDVAQAERDKARAAEEEARTEAAIAQAVNDFLNDDLLAQANPENEPDRDIKLRTVVDRAAEQIEGRFANQPLVEAAIRQTLGETYLSLGEYDKAQQQHGRAREIRQRELGPEHASTLSSMNSLAVAIIDQGQYAEAEQRLREVLELRRRVLGLEHPDTLLSANNLANALHRQGRSTEAEKLHREVLENQRRALGPEHPNTLSSMHNLANAISAASRYAEAEQIHREVLEIRQRVLGTEHPDTLVSMCNLAGKISLQGENAEASKRYREALEIQQRVLGTEHPHTLASMSNLATLARIQGRYAEAEQLDREVLAIRQRVLDTEHPDTLVSMYNLALSINCQGGDAEVGQLFREVLEIRQRVLGPEHPDTLKARSSLANFCTNYSWRLATAADPSERDPKEALKLTETAIELQPDSANNWDNLGVAQYRNALWQKSVESLERAREIRGGKDPVHQFFLAMAYWQLDQREDAVRNFVEADIWLTKKPRNEDQYRFRDEAEDVIAAENVIQECTTRIEAEPESGLLYAVRASAFARSGQTEEAAQDYIQALGLLPEHPEFERRGTYETLLRNPEVFARVTELQPDDTDLWIAHGREHARHERWKPALAGYQQVIDSDGVGHPLFEYANLLVINEEHDAYRDLCRRLEEQYVSTKNVGSAVIVCTLDPQSDVDPRRVLQWAKEASDSERDKQSVYELGLAHLRTGQFEEAAQLLEESHRDLGLRRPRTAFPLAMAYHHQGKEAESRQWFQEGLAELERLRQRGPLSIEWTVYWLELNARHREAAAILGEEDNPPAKAAPLQNTSNDESNVLVSTPAGEATDD